MASPPGHSITCPLGFSKVGMPMEHAPNTVADASGLGSAVGWTKPGPPVPP
jgi:hypothetical protein